MVVSFLGNWPELNSFVTSLSGIEEEQLSYQKEYMSSEAKTLESTLVTISKLQLHLKDCAPLWDSVVITTVFTCLPHGFGVFTYTTLKIANILSSL